MINFEMHSERHIKVAGKEVLTRYWWEGGGFFTTRGAKHGQVGQKVVSFKTWRADWVRS